MSAPWESEEKRNHIFMKTVVTDIVAEGLRDVFKQEWNNRYQSTFGSWDDTSASGQQLFHLEKTRSRPNKNVYQAKFQNGDTNQWDCSVLFDAILYSNSIGRASLNPIKYREVDNLRNIRNEIMHATESKLSDAEFKTKISSVKNALTLLGLPVNKVNQIETEKNRYNSFQVLPPKPGHDIVYRTEEISKISLDLEKLRSDNEGRLTYYYISGNPGSGKSQLSSQVCERIALDDESWSKETTFVMTLNANHLDSLLYSYEDLCRRLNGNEDTLTNILTSSRPMKEKIESLRSMIGSRMKTWKKWLLIVDNVENLTEISPLLPQSNDDNWANGQIIITTQNKTSIPSDCSFTKHISIGAGMNDADCQKLLSSLSKTDENDPLLNEVAEKLDRQPLAMAAAAVYLKLVMESNCPFSWQDYLEKLEKGKREITEKQLLHINSAYTSTMSAAVLLAVEKCADVDIFKYAFDLLSLVSFEPLPLDLFVKYIQTVDKDLDTEDVSLAIQQCSLFLPDRSGCYRLHRVVHDSIRLFCCNNNSKHSQSVSKCETSNDLTLHHDASKIRYVVQTLSSFKNRKDEVNLIPHLKAFLKAIRKHFSEQNALYLISLHFEKMEIVYIYKFFGHILLDHCEFEASCDFKNAILQIWHDSKDGLPVHVDGYFGKLYQGLGELDKAKQHLHNELVKCKELYGPNGDCVETSYSNLGMVYSEAGELEKGLQFYQHGLKICEKRPDPNDLKVAKFHNHIGTVFIDMGKMEEAKVSLKKALEIREQKLDSDHVELANTYNNLGAVYMDIGELEKAFCYFDRARKTFENQFSRKDINTSDIYHNLGSLYHRFGKLDTAKTYLEKALIIREGKLGQDHISVAFTYNSLGTVYKDASDLQNALDYLNRALKIRLEHLGKEHFLTAITYDNLGAVKARLGIIDEARDLYEKALSIRLKQFGNNNTSVACCYNNLGSLCFHEQEPEMAKYYLHKALEINKNKLGPKHLEVATSYNNLGVVYRASGVLDKCIDYHKMSLEIRLEKHGVDVAESYGNLGLAFYRAGDVNTAEYYWLEAAKTEEKFLSNNHIDVASSCYNLGKLYCAEDEPTKAIDFHKQSLEIRLKYLGLKNADIVASYHSLGLALCKAGDFETAIENWQRAIEIQQEILGPNNVEVATYQNELGLLYHAVGEMDKAINHLLRSLEILEKHFDTKHDNVIASYRQLCMVYRDTGDLEKAMEYHVREFQIPNNYNQNRLTPREGVLSINNLPIVTLKQSLQCIKLQI